VVIDSFFAPYPISQEERDRLRFQFSRGRTTALRQFYGASAHDAKQLDKIVAGAERVSPQTLLAYIDFASERDDLRRHSQEIRVPVHVLASPLLTEGQSDPARVRLALGQVGFAGLSNLSYDFFPASKHWLFWDEPEHFHASLETFLSRIEMPMAHSDPSAGPASDPLSAIKKGRRVAKASH
jgi:pimeloyl-ACP methyl ester carboxylesterase